MWLRPGDILCLLHFMIVCFGYTGVCTCCTCTLNIQANGPDSISNRLFKETSLCLLFHYFLSCGKVSICCKQVNAKPVYKGKNDRNDINANVNAMLTTKVLYLVEDLL